MNVQQDAGANHGLAQMMSRNLGSLVGSNSLQSCEAMQQAGRSDQLVIEHGHCNSRIPCCGVWFCSCAGCISVIWNGNDTKVGQLGCAHSETPSHVKPIRDKELILSARDCCAAADVTRPVPAKQCWIWRVRGGIGLTLGVSWMLPCASTTCGASSCDGMAETTTTDSVVIPDSVTSYDDGGRKQPPPEKAGDVRRRTLVIVSFWLIVLCLGLPIWWQTTTIYRAKLPLDEMLDWADGRVRSLFSLPSSIDLRRPCQS